MSFGAIFCLLTLLTTWKIKILKNTPEDIIILHMCIINKNHMMYGSWDMERERQIFFSFWTIFCLFTPLTTQKIKILKKWKKCLEISSFYTSVPKIMIICYTIPEILRMMNVIVTFFSSWLIFSFLNLRAFIVTNAL